MPSAHFSTISPPHTPPRRPASLNKDQGQQGLISPVRTPQQWRRVLGPESPKLPTSPADIEQFLDDQNERVRSSLSSPDYQARVREQKAALQAKKKLKLEQYQHVSGLRDREDETLAEYLKKGAILYRFDRPLSPLQNGWDDSGPEVSRRGPSSLENRVAIRHRFLGCIVSDTDSSTQDGSSYKSRESDANEGVSDTDSSTQDGSSSKSRESYSDEVLANIGRALLQTLHRI